MRRLRYAPLALAPVLAMTGLAIAGGHGPTTTQVAASFSTSAQHVKTTTCTGTDGNYMVTDATYNGTVSGTLTGGITDSVMIHARSVVNQSSGAGTTVGHFRIMNGRAHVLDGSLQAVDSGSGTLSGFLAGHVHGGPPPPPRPPAGLLANVSGTLSSNGLSGQIGGNGTTSNSAVEQISGPCPPPPPPPHSHSHPAPPPHAQPQPHQHPAPPAPPARP